MRFGRQDAVRAVRASSNDTVQPTKPRSFPIEDEDFRAHFDVDKRLVEWRWTTGPPVLTNQVGCYEGTLREEVRPKFEKKVERWIDERILILWSGKVEGVLPLIAIVQLTKNKLRPVLDFRELNKYVACHTKDGIDICEEVMRVAENGESHKNRGLKVGLPSNSRGREIVAVSIGQV